VLIPAQAKQVTHRPLEAADLPRDPEAAFNWIDGWMTAQIAWYRTKKKQRQALSIVVRSLSVGLLIAGTACPLLSAAIAQDLKSWGFVLLGIGASLLIVDQAFGLTSAWIRLLETALKLEGLQMEARVRWAVAISEGGDWPKLALKNVADFTSTIEQETAKWAKEAADASKSIKSAR